MIRKRNRIAFTLVALLGGVGIIFLLSMISDKSRGPLENIFTGASAMIIKFENHFIIEKMKHKRSEKLAWLQYEKTNLSTSKTILLGAYDNQIEESFQSIVSLEDSLHLTLPLIHIYTAWGSKPEQRFPGLQVQTIVSMGSIPVITWEPWLSDFDASIPGLRPAAERDRRGFADIAKGIYDFYLVRWAKEAKESGTPIFLRLGHEMNDPYRYPWGPQNNPAKDFIDGWKHVYTLFHKMGANNVYWIWSPHPAYGYFDVYYPGDAFVDYVGASALNYGPIAVWSKWYSFDQIFGKNYAALAEFNKPIVIAEFGSLAYGGDRTKWFNDALASLPEKYPLVKSILFFHYSDDKTVSQQSLNWYFKDDASVRKAIMNQIGKWPEMARPKS